VKNVGTIVLGAIEVPSGPATSAARHRPKYRTATAPAATADVAVRASRYERTLIESRSAGSRTVLADKEIDRMPTRSVTDVASTTTAVFSGRGGAVSISGGRAGAATTVAVGSMAVEARDAPALASPAEGDGALLTGTRARSSGAARAGSLTSGESNDFSKWTLWEDMVGPALETHKSTWKMHPQRRYSVSVQSANGSPVVGASVKLLEGSTPHWEAVTITRAVRNCGQL
jgi:hypothetical protein